MTFPLRVALAGAALALALLVVLLAAGRAGAQAGTWRFEPSVPHAQAWETAGEKVNPADNAVLAETAPFAAAGVQQRRVEVTNRSAAIITVRFEWHTAPTGTPPTTTVKRAWLYIAHPNMELPKTPPAVLVAKGEKFVLRLLQPVTGTVQGHLVGP
ncbi:MAG: hypothetical protein ACRENJ_02615 [Candidatus Eiseniibacteriota bacterium]